MLLFLLLLITTLASSTSPLSWIQDCRSADFVAFTNIQANYPDDFPSRFKRVIDEFLLDLSEAIQVRLLPNYNETHLIINFAYTRAIFKVAYTLPIKKDGCERPKQAIMKINKNLLRIFFSHFKEVIFHELLHLMGFNNDHYMHYHIVGNNYRRSLTNGFILEQTDGNNKTSFYVVSPNVMEALKKINQTLIGAPLQKARNENGEIIPGDHWHRKKFTDQIGCDIMRPFGLVAPITEVTTAFVNDFGWYRIDHEKMLEVIKMR
jgi:Leishmanolysin